MTITCPTEPQEGVTPADDILGCGSTDVVGPDSEGFYDCRNCGIWFSVPTGPIPARQTVSVSLRVDVDMTPELGRRLTEHLRDLLINHVGDATDDEGWDAATAPLDALMARAFDRGLHPLAEMVDVSGEDLWEDFVTFGKAWPIDQPALSRYGPDTTASDLIDKYIEPAYADLMNLASQVEGAETSAALQSAMLMSELSKELHRLLPDTKETP